MQVKMSDILKPGAKLKAYKLSSIQVREILNDVEIKQSEIRKLKNIKQGELDKLITI